MNRTISKIGSWLLQRFPESRQILLFGSFCRHTHDPKDCDVAIVMRSKTEARGLASKHNSLVTEFANEFGIKLDLVVFHEQEYTEAAEFRDRLATDGFIVLYDLQDMLPQVKTTEVDIERSDTSATKKPWGHQGFSE